MSVESKYNIMNGLTEKKKWVKPEIFTLRVKNTKNGQTTHATETTLNTATAFS